MDEFTGRTMADRRWGEGLHQAVEAKESLPIQNETVSLASISYQVCSCRLNPPSFPLLMAQLLKCSGSWLLSCAHSCEAVNGTCLELPFSHALSGSLVADCMLPVHGSRAPNWSFRSLHLL